MNIIFAGTPAFSAVILDVLLHSEHKILAVYTQPDRPAGRGQKLTKSPVKELAEKHHLPVHQPVTLRNEEEQQKIAALHADVMVVVAYGLILPKAVLQTPRLGCLNIHASLLPRWRGAAPIQRAILAGDAETGVTIMQMDEGLDTGGMLYKMHCPIYENDTSETVHDRLAKMGCDALLTTLKNLAEIKREPQDNSLATYANKISKEEARLDWQASAAELSRKIRAFNPWPVAYFTLSDNTVRVWEAEVMQKTAAKPGVIMQVSKEGIDVATGKDVLRLKKCQLPGGRALPVADILNSRKSEFAVGNVLT